MGALRRAAAAVAAAALAVAIAAVAIAAVAVTAVPLARGGRAPTPGELQQWFEALAGAAVAEERAGAAAFAYVDAATDTVTRVGAGACYGLDGAPRADRGPADPDSLFRVGSVTKLFTATAVFQLVDRGQLSLQTPLADVFPEPLRGRLGARAPAPVVLDLLRHTLPLDERALGLEEAGDGGPVDLGRLLADVWTGWTTPQDAPLRISYSNMGVGLEGAVVEAVSGVPLDAFVHDNIVVPLGLTGVQFHQALQGDYSRVCYGPTARNFEPFQVLATSSGDLYATTADVVRFLAAHALGGRGLFANASTAALMHAVVYPGETVLPGLFQGMAHQFFAEVVLGTRVLSHSGGVYSFDCFAFLYPDYLDAAFFVVTPGRQPASSNLPQDALLGFTAEFHNSTGTADAFNASLPWRTLESAALARLVGTYLPARRVHFGITAVLGLFSPFHVELADVADDAGGTAAGLVVRVGSSATYGRPVWGAVDSDHILVFQSLPAENGRTQYLVATFSGPVSDPASIVVQIEDPTSATTLFPMTFASNANANLLLLLVEGIVIAYTLLAWAVAPAVLALYRRACNAGPRADADAAESRALLAAQPAVNTDDDDDDHGHGKGADEGPNAGPAAARRAATLFAVAKGLIGLVGVAPVVGFAIAFTTPIPNIQFGLNPVFLVIASGLLVHLIGVLGVCATTVAVALAGPCKWKAPFRVSTIQLVLAVILAVLQVAALVAFVNLNFVAFRFW